MSNCKMIHPSAGRNRILYNKCTFHLIIRITAFAEFISTAYQEKSNFYWLKKKRGVPNSFIFHMFTRSTILRLAEPLNIFVAFLMPVEKKNHKTKFKIEEENTKLQIGRKQLLWPLLCSAYKWSAGQSSQSGGNFERSQQSKLKKIKGKAKL